MDAVPQNRTPKTVDGELTERQRALAAVKFMGLGGAAPLEEPQASWVARFRVFLSRANGGPGAARP